MPEEAGAALEFLDPILARVAATNAALAARAFTPDLLLRAQIDHGGTSLFAIITSFDADGVTLALDIQTPESLIQLGDSLALTLHRHTRRIGTTLLIVDRILPSGVLSCRFKYPHDTLATTTHSWYRLNTLTLPLFYIEHPWQAGVLVRGDLVAVGKLCLLVNTTYIDFFPGLALRCSIQVVGKQQHNFNATLASLRRVGNRLECSLELIDPPASLLDTIGNVCLTSGTSEGANERIRMARKFGYRARELGDIIEIERCTVDTPGYRDALNLRFEAYRNVGKVSPKASPESMADEFDAHAIILVAKLAGDPVGTLTLVDGWRAGRSLPLLKYYKRSDVAHVSDVGTIEFCRFAITDSFQHTDVIVSLMRAAFEHCMISDFRVGYLLATPKLRKLYSRMGAQTLADGVPHEYAADETLSLMRFTMSDFRKARGTSIALWDRIARPPLAALRKLGLYKPTLVERLVFPIRRLVENVYVIFIRYGRTHS